MTEGLRGLSHLPAPLQERELLINIGWEVGAAGL